MLGRHDVAIAVVGYLTQQRMRLGQLGAHLLAAHVFLMTRYRQVTNFLAQPLNLGGVGVL